MPAKDASKQAGLSEREYPPKDDNGLEQEI
jgi:hypothetical protein